MRPDDQRNERRARVGALDERDHELLLRLLEHKVLTTHQVKSLYFRSPRRCQHRLSELKGLGVVSSFTPQRGFGEGRPPACWYLTKLGLAEIAFTKGVRASDLSWIPDERYRASRNLAHRLGVNALFCALAEASRRFPGHCLVTWRPERWVRTRAAEVKPDGFGQYLHPGGACEFYLEYDQGTEATGALSGKLEGYLRLAAGWTAEQDVATFPNLLVVVPDSERKEAIGSAFHFTSARLHVSAPLASVFPLYVASEKTLMQLGVLGPVWIHVPTEVNGLSLPDLPARPRDPYGSTRCIGRYFTDEDPIHRRRISPASASPRFSAPPPRHGP